MICKYCGQEATRQKRFCPPNTLLEECQQRQQLAELLRHYHLEPHNWPGPWEVIHRPYGWHCPLCDVELDGWYLLMADHILTKHNSVEEFETLLSIRSLGE